MEAYLDEIGSWVSLKTSHESNTGKLNYINMSQSNSSFITLFFSTRNLCLKSMAPSITTTTTQKEYNDKSKQLTPSITTEKAYNDKRFSQCIKSKN